MSATQIIERFNGPYAFLSDFYRAPFVATTFYQIGIEEELTFPTVEHWFNAHKATNAGEFRRVLEAASPQIAKRLGRAVTLREGWDRDGLRLDVMAAGLRHKFTQHQDLARALDGTGNAELQEGNDWGDVFWGRVWNPGLEIWEGENTLGRLLMELRQELRDDA